jgi:hypothetical protein
MNDTNHIFTQSRRRFLGMLCALGTLLSWPARGRSEYRLSRHEASYYRKGRRNNS